MVKHRSLAWTIVITNQQQEIYAKIPSNYEIVLISDISINEFSGTVNILNLELE